MIKRARKKAEMDRELQREEKQANEEQLQFVKLAADQHTRKLARDRQRRKRERDRQKKHTGDLSKVGHQSQDLIKMLNVTCLIALCIRCYTR